MALKILPLGGLGEIGMNCMALEYQDEIVVVDCGLMFSDLEHFGVEYVLPQLKYLLERKDKIKGFLVTHGHEDHIGALPFAVRMGIDAPIYASPFSSLLIKHRLKDVGLEGRAEVRTFRMGDQLQFEHFKVTTVAVNHSIVDAAALIIDTPVGKVIHTGDFRIDASPFYGKPLDLGVFKQAGDQGVRLLMSDSTNVERHEHGMSESKIYGSFEQLFAAAEGLTVVSMFASNVARIGQVLEVAQKLNKKVALTGRSMLQNSEFGEQLGYLKAARSVLIDLDQVGEYERNKVIILSTGSQAEPRAALMRMARGEHSQIELQEGDLVLMSSKFIPGNEKAIGHMINELFKTGAEVLYEAVHDIHTSGHATRPELQKMIEAVRPQFFLPIHGEYRHLVHHADLAEECGVAPDNILIAVNGESMELEPDRFEIVDQMDETRILMPGREGGEIPLTLLRERRHLGEKGVMFALLARSNESKMIVGGPEILAKGLADPETEMEIIPDARKVVGKVVKAYTKELDDRGPKMDLAEEIRVNLRRFLNERLGKKPTVVPVIMDI